MNYGVGWWPNEGFDNELISTLESKATTHEGFLEPMQQGSQYSSSISHKSSVLLLLQAIPNSYNVSRKNLPLTYAEMFRKKGCSQTIIIHSSMAEHAGKHGTQVE